MSIIGRMKMKKFCNKHKKVIVIVVLLLLCVLIVVGYRINSFLDKKNESNENNDSGQIIDYKNIIYSYGNELEKISIDYYNENKEFLSFDELLNKVKFTNDVSCELNVVNNDGTIYLENCTVDGEFVEGYTYGEKKENDKTINEDDGTIIIYEKNGQATMNVPENMTDYKIYSVDVNGSMYEILKGLGSYLFYVDANYNGQMINYKTNEKILNNVIYDAVYPIYKSDSEFYDSSNIIIRKDNKWSIYDLGTGNRRGSVYESFDIIGRETSVGPRTEIETLVGNNIMVKNNGKYGVIDYVTGKVVVPIRYNSIYKEYNYLVVDNDIYDFYGKSYLGGIYNKVYGISKNSFVFVNDNGKYKIIDINKNIKYDFGKVDSDSEIVLRNSYVDGNLVVFSCYAKNNNVNYIYHFEYNFDNNTGNVRKSKN